MHITRTVLYYSRPKKDLELSDYHYHFRSREEIESLSPPRYVVFPVRDELQALDLEDIREKLETYDVVFVEIYHTVIDKLREWAQNYGKAHYDFEISSIFLLPVSYEELNMIEKHAGKPPEDIMYELVAGKMHRRGKDSPESIERQARDAWWEMQSAMKYDHRIVCPHGEDEIDLWMGHIDEMHPHIHLVIEQFRGIIQRDPGKKKLVILSGPSCTGKGPLWAAYYRLFIGENAD